MLAKDIMTTQVLTVPSTMRIKDAMKMLVDIEISGLIVTDDDNNILGVVTERDLLVAYDFLKETKPPISDFMNRDVISVSEDTPFEEISKMLIEGDIRRVPVVKDKKAIGIVSRRDLIKAVLKLDESKEKSA